MRPLLCVLALALALPTSAQEPGLGRRLAITIDDLPINGADTGLRDLRSINDRILKALGDARVPAVGFVNEAKLYQEGEVDGRIALLEAWLAAGLELGNHTWSHPDFNSVGLAAYEEEIVRGESVTRLLLAKRQKPLRLFRQTFLRTGKTLEDKAALEAYLEGRGYLPVPVTVENDDWWFNSKYAKARAAGDTALMKRIADEYVVHWGRMFDWYESLALQVFGRPIDHVVLMHQNVLNAERLPEVLALMRKRGYAFATVDEVMKDPAYAHEDRYAGPWGKSWLQRWALAEGIDTLGKEPDPPDWFVKLFPEKD